MTETTPSLLPSIDDFLDKIEHPRRFLSDGIPKYQYRTISEKIHYCGRWAYFKIGGGAAGLRYVREWPCGIVQGNIYCEKCRKRRKDRRRTEFNDRINRAELDVLFVARINGEDSLNRFRRNCSYHGFDYFAVPTIVSGERIAAVDGKVKGSLAMDSLEVAKLMASYSGILTKARISGKLGRLTEKEKSDKNKNKIASTLNTISFEDGRKPTDYSIIEKINLRAVWQTSASPDFVITEDNVQEFLLRRQKATIRALRQFGYKPYEGKEITEYTNINEANANFQMIVGGYELKGTYSSFGRTYAEKMLESTMDNFDAIGTKESWKEINLSP